MTVLEEEFIRPLERGPGQQSCRSQRQQDSTASVAALMCARNRQQRDELTFVIVPSFGLPVVKTSQAGSDRR
jgi:hypothetical protein